MKRFIAGAVLGAVVMLSAGAQASTTTLGDQLDGAAYSNAAVRGACSITKEANADLFVSCTGTSTVYLFYPFAASTGYTAFVRFASGRIVQVPWAPGPVAQVTLHSPAHKTIVSVFLVKH
jgi:hypothetical protein